jgi:hypothetical protein
MTDLSVKYTKITPEIAGLLLRKNVENNRTLMPSVVSKYAQLMKVGQWDANTGDTIKISDDGFVLDGQHRLYAVVKSGVTIYSFVAYGLSKDSFRNIDIGKSRKTADALHFSGIPTSKVVAAAVQLYYSLKNGTQLSVMRTPSAPGREHAGGGNIFCGSATSVGRLSSLDIEKIYFAKREKWQKYVSTYLRKCRVIDTSSNIAGMWAYLADINEDDADEFFARLVEGDSLSTGSPILALRERLLAAKTTKAGYLSSSERRAVYVSAWNAYRRGKAQNSIRIPDLSIMPI